MKKIVYIILCIICISVIISACAKPNNSGYMSITSEEAKKLMENETDYVILDVRDKEEYDEGHIPKALVIPYTEIKNKAEEKLTDKEQLVLVYCRSGRRSKIAAKELAELGYTNVKEFGGIIDWNYEIEN